MSKRIFSSIALCFRPPLQPGKNPLPAIAAVRDRSCSSPENYRFYAAHPVGCSITSIRRTDAKIDSIFGSRALAAVECRQHLNLPGFSPSKLWLDIKSK
ncbi:hypothetical protein [Rhizobium leguminosarum]|uniref:hypothetical protein n=1 Tax=Rhizobium leguminosarum TaxID=384 RepID=UPI000F7ADA7C|nr:hypothetical protein [Rhizobium leguminosarum]